MASITFAVDEELMSRISRFSWVNWSELARERLIERGREARAFERFKELVAKSRLSEEDAKELADKVDEGMLKELREEFPGL